MKIITIAGAVGMLVLTAGAAAAQVQSSATCPYDACAVRHEVRLFSENLVRGTGSERVLKIGFTGGNAAEYLGRVEAAAAPARAFKAQRTRAQVFGILSAVLMGVFAATAEDTDDGDFPTATQGGLLLGGIVTALVAGIETANSRNSLSRAIWEFNRAPVR